MHHIKHEQNLLQTTLTYKHISS